MVHGSRRELGIHFRNRFSAASVQPIVRWFMPRIKITAIEHLRYEKIVEVTEDELIDLELNAHDTYPDRADFGLTEKDADSPGLESVEIEILPQAKKRKAKST